MTDGDTVKATVAGGGVGALRGRSNGLALGNVVGAVLGEQYVGARRSIG